MGTGFFSEATATLNLRVSFRYDAVGSVAGLQQWHEILAWASQMLWQASEGQMRLGRIEYVNNDSSDIGQPDLYVTQGPNKQSWQLGFGEISGGHMLIGVPNIIDRPGLLVHELGHYVWDLYEEYLDENGNAGFCIDDALASGCCIMQADSNSIDLSSGTPLWTQPTAGEPLVTQFCQHNHAVANFNHRETLPRTLQELEHGVDCWRKIREHTPSLTLLGTSPPVPLPSDAAPDPIPPVTMVEVNSGSRFVLALDRSGSMATDGAIEGVRYAAATWIDLEALFAVESEVVGQAPEGNELGMVSFATSATPDFPPTVITQGDFEDFPGEDEQTIARNVLVPGGSTNITEALDVADMQLDMGAPVWNRAILLFSDGKHNVGVEPLAKAAQIAAGGTTIHTVGFGPEADIETLLAITKTPPFDPSSPKVAGVHRHIESTTDASFNEWEINSELSYLAAHSHSSELNHARVMLDPDPMDDEGPQGEPGSPDDLAFIAGLSKSDVERLGHMFDLEVEIEEGATRATFVATFRSRDSLFAYLLGPDGQPQSPIDGVFAARPGHAIYSIDDPAEGPWTMRIRRRDIRREDQAPAALFAFGETPALTTVLIGASDIHAVDEAVPLRAGVQFPRILTAIEIRIRPEDDPEGWVRFEESARLGQYRLNLDSPGQPGSHGYVVEYRGDENATEAPSTRGLEGDQLFSATSFRRIRRIQIHVGPLQIGVDTDSLDSDEPDGLCAALIALVTRICVRGSRLLGEIRKAFVRRSTPTLARRLGRARSTAGRPDSAPHDPRYGRSRTFPS